jgi:3'(2'), 5'-bisphosphate nucleotidase
MRFPFSSDSILSIIQQAGRAVLSVYTSGIKHTLKKDCSPLTEADRTSHRIIVEGLTRIAPGIPVLSEEGEEIGYNIRRNWDSYFLIDPLDGTQEFIESRPEFTVNIALIYQSRPVIGLIHVPVNGITYFAEEGKGAYRLNGNTERLPLRKDPSRKVEIVVSRRETEESLKKILSGIPDAGISSMGSSLKFCLVAEGSSDIYPRTKPSMEWDTAAGAIIVEEAGGQIVETSGQTILYNRENLLNPPFFALSKIFPEKVSNWKLLLLDKT